jgi:fatty-acyl-CoA synthase
MTAPITQNPHVTLPSLIENLAQKFGDAPALLSDAECLTYRALAARSNQYSRWALEQGLSRGDVVCLIMSNRPEYVAIWLGITRIGAIVSLINTHLEDSALAHSLDLSSPKHVIMDAEFGVTVDGVMTRLGTGIRYWTYGPTSFGFARIDSEIDRCDNGDLRSSDYQRPSIADTALYIYTSGTTGLPKAAKVSHFRILQWSYWFAGLMDARPSDRMYNCLPMYHSIGGIVAVGAILVSGGSVLVRRRFSASGFWDDVAEWKCTIFQYIGELCRYLVNSPPHPHETNHEIRLCCGNGLQLEVWNAFRRRFRIPQILEFYATTEGNVSLYNCEEKPGSIGRMPAFLAHRAPVALVKFDIATNEPVRSQDGFCVRCGANEVGEAIGRLPNASSGFLSRFEGYTDRTASDKKILRNVFSAGDAWLRTGDLMRMDEQAYFYFVDRVGDTFRWKGENVSTAEVADIVASHAGVIDAVVYGVKVPGSEGRAGMAALVIGEDFDLGRFRVYLAKRLPSYARPVFLRICRSIEMTGTFKAKKTSLARDGFDLSAIDDPVYIDDPASGIYIPFEAGLYERFRKGEGRL